jgi:predicted ATP-dependent serine protease
VLLAVLERRGGASFAQLDVFVQVTAGVDCENPAPDLAVAAALLSSLHKPSYAGRCAVLGEIGLGWRGPPIGGWERRSRSKPPRISPAFALSRQGAQVPGLRHVSISHVDELAGFLAA